MQRLYDSYHEKPYQYAKLKQQSLDRFKELAACAHRKHMRMTNNSNEDQSCAQSAHDLS